MNRVAITIAAGIFGILALNSFFIVKQQQQALVLQFGEVVRVIKEPGLTFKIPFIQKVTFFDNRVLNLSADEKEVIAKDQKRLIVTAFAKYKITDPLKFYQTVRDEDGIALRLNSVVESSLRQILGSVPLATLLTGERGKIMQDIRDVVNKQASGLGINVVDVRIMRADLPKENSEAIFQRMQTEREKEAKEFRAEGAEESLRIKAHADKERKIILAEAQLTAQVTRGEGDAVATKNFADAFSKDAEFFDFYRSMQAYKNTLRKTDTTMVLSPRSDFLRFFGSTEGKSSNP
jgi:modulator of FtsH protease HflC